MLEDAESVASRAKDELSVARMAAGRHPRQAFELAGKALSSALRAACMADGWDYGEGDPVDSLLASFPEDAYGVSSAEKARQAAVSLAAWAARGGRGGDAEVALMRDLGAVADLVGDVEAFVDMRTRAGIAMA